VCVCVFVVLILLFRKCDWRSPWLTISTFLKIMAPVLVYAMFIWSSNIMGWIRDSQFLVWAPYLKAWVSFPKKIRTVWYFFSIARVTVRRKKGNRWSISDSNVSLTLLVLRSPLHGVGSALPVLLWDSIGFSSPDILSPWKRVHMLILRAARKTNMTSMFFYMRSSLRNFASRSMQSRKMALVFVCKFLPQLSKSEPLFSMAWKSPTEAQACKIHVQSHGACANETNSSNLCRFVLYMELFVLCLGCLSTLHIRLIEFIFIRLVGEPVAWSGNLFRAILHAPCVLGKNNVWRRLE